MACELPAKHSVALTAWDCQELARQLTTDGVVAAISPDTVRRILANQQLKPWRVHAWLSPKVPRDAAFVTKVREIIDLYTRQLSGDDMVLCVDEKTSLQPRKRAAPSMAAAPKRPVRVEHEYARDGALHLIAAFDTRTGKVSGMRFERKRAVEFVAFLEHLELRAARPELWGKV